MLKKENEALRSENEALKVALQKSEYRVRHLIRSLEEEEKKDEVIQKMQYRINHLIRSLNEAEGAAAPASSPAAVEIASNDPFWGVDLVVGRIVKAWKHEKADKLICEVIDCGEAFGGERKIASGLYQFYRPEEIEGRLVVVVANLKEKPLVGYPSHGMVLCACKEDHTAVEVVFGSCCEVDRRASCRCQARHEGDSGGPSCVHGADKGDQSSFDQECLGADAGCTSSAVRSNCAGTPRQ